MITPFHRHFLEYLSMEMLRRHPAVSSVTIRSGDDWATTTEAYKGHRCLIEISLSVHNWWRYLGDAELQQFARVFVSKL